MNELSESPSYLIRQVPNQHVLNTVHSQSVVSVLKLQLCLHFWGGSKITADGDCSHEIKRLLFLERKVMTNLDSILKSRDTSLLTKVHLVKAIGFPLVMYGCESWTTKKAEHRRIDVFEPWCWRRLLNPLDCKEIQPVHPKGNQS